MGFFSLHSPLAFTRPPSSSASASASSSSSSSASSSSSTGRATMERTTSFSGQPLTFPGSGKRRPDARNHPCCLNFRPLAFGALQSATGSNPKIGETLKQEIHAEDNDLVFVAGATGRVGSRTVRDLLRLGFRVRAGVRNAQRAELLVQSVREMKLGDVVGSSGSQPVERLEIVECDLERQGAIGPAIGSASTVICCIGASEKEVFDVTGPYRIDYLAAKNLIQAATLAKVDHFILLTSLGTNKIGFPAFILNLFWGVLIWKRKAEEALIASGLPYTIVRPGGMERPTDSYKETHNIVLANEDTYFGGQVSNLQVAELMAFMAKNRRLSIYKVVEVIAETSVPLTPMDVLLAKIPPQREIQPEPRPDPVPPRLESEPTKPVAVEEPSQMEVLKERPLSQITAYEDLKPPTSPTPTQISASTSTKKRLVNATPPLEFNATDGTARTTLIDVKEHVKGIKQQKSRPLSPFTMYEDLKPPTSPLPSVPKY